MSLLDTFPQEWRTDVMVQGPASRDAEGLLVGSGAPVSVRGCLVAPGESAAPGADASATSEATSDTAMIYAPPGAPIRRRDTVTVPGSHRLAGVWMVETSPEPWPMGLVATMVRR